MYELKLSLEEDLKQIIENKALAEGKSLNVWALDTIRKAVNVPTEDLTIRNSYCEKIKKILKEDKKIDILDFNTKNLYKSFDNDSVPNFELYIKKIEPLSNAPISLLISILSRDFCIRFECFTRSRSDTKNSKRRKYIDAFNKNKELLSDLGFRDKHGTMSYVIEMRKSSKNGEALKLSPEEYVDRMLTLKNILAI